MTKEEKREYNKQYYAKNREKMLEQMKEYYAANRKKRLEYFKTPMGRAHNLLMAYNTTDKKKGRGKGNLTPEWIVENIFTKPCVHCGESDWKKIGCNRIDNSKPHTKDNVEPCCWECNLKLEGKEQKQVFQYTLDNELIRVWESTNEAGRNGFNQGAVSTCCNGIRNTHKGYRWSYQPL